RRPAQHGRPLRGGRRDAGAAQPVPDSGFAADAGDALDRRHGARLGADDVGLRLHMPRLTPQVKQTLKIMGPGVLGAGVTQLNLLISTALASTLPGGSVSYLYYADRLNQLPLGVVGIAVATAILPPLSRQVRGGDEAGAVATQNRGLELALLLTWPAATARAILALPIL